MSNRLVNGKFLLLLNVNQEASELPCKIEIKMKCKVNFCLGLSYLLSDSIRYMYTFKKSTCDIHMIISNFHKPSQSKYIFWIENELYIEDMCCFHIHS